MTMNTPKLVMSNNNTAMNMQLRIWQQNVCKSWTAMLHLLNEGLHNDYDVLALQEPYPDSLGNTWASHKWQVIYPTMTTGGCHPYHAVLLINSSISTSICQPIPIPSHNIIAVHFAFPNNPLFSAFTMMASKMSPQTLS